MSSTTIHPGQLVLLDPSDKRLFNFDWNQENLEDGVEITTSTFTITALKQVGLTALTKDNETILSGNRITQLRLLATTGTVGDKYEIANTIITNENPNEQKERSFKVLIQNR